MGLVVLGAAALSAPLEAQGKPDWQQHCDACIGYYSGNPAEVHCQGDYAATYPECLAGGGACLMVRGVAAVKAGDCDKRSSSPSSASATTARRKST